MFFLWTCGDIVSWPQKLCQEIVWLNTQPSCQFEMTKSMVCWKCSLKLICWWQKHFKWSRSIGTWFNFSKKWWECVCSIRNPWFQAIDWGWLSHVWGEDLEDSQKVLGICQSARSPISWCHSSGFSSFSLWKRLFGRSRLRNVMTNQRIWGHKQFEDLGCEECPVNPPWLIIDTLELDEVAQWGWTNPVW